MSEIQNRVAPWIKVTPLIEESRPEPAMTIEVEQRAKAAVKEMIKKYFSLFKAVARAFNFIGIGQGLN